MKKVIQTWICDLTKDNGSVLTQFSLTRDLEKDMYMIVATEKINILLDSVIQTNNYTVSAFEEIFKINMADVLEKSQVTLNDGVITNKL